MGSLAAEPTNRPLQLSKPNINTTDISTSLNDISAAHSNGTLTLDDGERKALLHSCERLKRELESPAEAVMGLMFSVRAFPSHPNTTILWKRLSIQVSELLMNC